MEALDGVNGTQFQFTLAEVAEMEDILTRHNGSMPTREVHETLAGKFSFVRKRNGCGQGEVHEIQVREWFQGKGDALKAKDCEKSKVSSVPSSPTFRLEEQNVDPAMSRDMTSSSTQPHLLSVLPSETPQVSTLPPTGSETNICIPTNPKSIRCREISSTDIDSQRPSSSQRPSQAILHPNMDADDIIHPGPIDDSVLSQQRTHRTEAIWNPQLDPKGKANVPLKIHKGGALTLDARLRPYVVAAGFYSWTQVCDIKVDPSLLTAVVERWRSETHTFHFNDGEATITLQDVSLLTGLPVEGEPVTGKSQLNFNEVSVRLLGVYPECYDKAPGMAKRSWFKDHLAQIPADADEETLKKYARAYLLNLIGLTLFTDKGGKTIPLYFLPLLEDLDRVRNYSWGSAVLANLYSNMCSACKIGHSQLGGAPLIIQFWSWDRLSRIGAPKVKVPIVLPPPDAEFDPALRGAWSYLRWIGPKSWVGVCHGSLLQYRDAIQKMQPRDFTWRPYDETMFELLNPTCLEGRETTWRADVPLICFNIIEWQHPARVARQYGFRQGVPPNAIGSSDRCHGMDRKKNRDWAVFHSSYIALWYTRHERLVDRDMAYLGDEIDQPTSQYVQWYLRHTRRLYQPRIVDEVEEVGDDDTQQTRPSPTYRPDSHTIPENICGYVICARDASSYFLNSTDDYSRKGFHKIFHTAYTEVGKLMDPIIVGVDPQTITLDAGDAVDDDSGWEEAYDTHVEEQMDNHYQPSSSSQAQKRART